MGRLVFALFAACLIIASCLVFLALDYVPGSDIIEPSYSLVPQNAIIDDTYASLPQVDRNSSFIFIGGVPRSGTTLIRVLLDAHPLIRCGPETHVIPLLLDIRGMWKGSEKFSQQMEEGGVTDKVLNAAISAFITEIVIGHGEPAERMCNKDPLTLKHTEYLAEIFPNSKYILMLRDGRATVHSIISRNVTVTGFYLGSYRQCLMRWNQVIATMYNQCNLVGPQRCFKMYYEQLVLHPEKQMRELLAFLGTPWNDAVLHHEDESSEIALSAIERSTDQVLKPINLDALSNWVGQFPKDVVRNMASIAPMLQLLGYDPEENPPDYGKLDDNVMMRANDAHENDIHWINKINQLVGKIAESGN